MARYSLPLRIAPKTINPEAPTRGATVEPLPPSAYESPDEEVVKLLSEGPAIQLRKPEPRSRRKGAALVCCRDQCRGRKPVSL